MRLHFSFRIVSNRDSSAVCKVMLAVDTDSSAVSDFQYLLAGDCVIRFISALHAHQCVVV